MINCNPIHYLKHAWEATNSIWGKLCIILFYTFIWLQILGGVWSLFAPSVGWECLWGAVEDSDLNMIVATMKSLNVWILGFFLYADRGGIKLGNVFMVWIVYLVQWLVYKPAITDFLEDACPEDLQQMNTAMMVTEIWMFLALVCSILDSWSGNLGETADESRPLNE